MTIVKFVLFFFGLLFPYHFLFPEEYPDKPPSLDVAGFMNDLSQGRLANLFLPDTLSQSLRCLLTVDGRSIDPEYDSGKKLWYALLPPAFINNQNRKGALSFKFFPTSTKSPGLWFHYQGRIGKVGFIIKVDIEGRMLLFGSGAKLAAICEFSNSKGFFRETLITQIPKTLKLSELNR